MLIFFRKYEDFWNFHLATLLWGYLKDTVYRNYLETLDKLEVEILREMRDIHASMYELLVPNFIDLLEQVIEANGDHFENYK